MTIEFSELALYIGGLLLLVLTPGPVVAAVVARVLARGLSAAWPIAAAVMVGDFIWVTIALVGLSALIADNKTAMLVIQLFGAAYLFYLGVQEIRHAGDKIRAAKLSQSRDFWPNFRDGFIIIMTNPKAALFYIAFVPTFFELPALNRADILAIGVVTAIVPFVGNMVWAAAAHSAKRLFDSEEGAANLRRISGAVLIIVAISLLFL